MTAENKIKTTTSRGVLLSALAFFSVLSIHSEIYAKAPSCIAIITTDDPDVRKAKKLVIEAEVKKQSLFNGAALVTKEMIAALLNQPNNEFKNSLKPLLKSDENLQDFVNVVAMIAFDVAEQQLLGVSTAEGPVQSENVYTLAEKMSTEGNLKILLNVASKMASQVINDQAIAIFIAADKLYPSITEALKETTDKYLAKKLSREEEDTLFAKQSANKDYISFYDRQVVIAKGHGVKIGFDNENDKVDETDSQRATKNQQTGKVGLL